jgi:hypothetical protein
MDDTGRGGAISEHIEFFAAPDDPTAAAVRTTGPAPYFTTVSGAFFDADDAVVTWENLLAGRAGNNMATSDNPRMVAPWVNDGSAVFALSDHLVACLVRTEPSRLQEIAEAWSAGVRQNGDDIGPDEALGILVGLARLARDAVRSGHRVYCWVSG